MDTTAAVDLFGNNWFLRDVEIPDLAAAERLLITAAMGPSPKRWEGRPDVYRMAEVLADNPGVLDRIGSHMLQVIVGMRGCGPAVTFLLDHGVPFEIDESAYNVLHEAAWGGMYDTLKAVFESGAADATCVSVLKPHVGWPDNLSLMYWAAVGGYVECAELLIEYGVGMHHELPIKGNGERGTTSLQEAVAPSRWGGDPTHLANRLAAARILIGDGAYYDFYSACALNDTSRLQELVDQDPDVVNAPEDYGMTPLHWAARAGSMECAEKLLECEPLLTP